MDILKKVRSTILERGLFRPGEPVVVGVSGGPDSLALLHILRGLAPELGISLHVAHLNHGLRGAESDADGEFVSAVAREWGLPATVETRRVTEYACSHHLSTEAAARAVRYAFLAEVAARQSARVVAVGHSADDQVETVLMHFLRGTGLAGLRGMQHKAVLPDDRGEIELVRPLLDVTRQEIEAYCAEHGLTPRLDSSNLDMNIFRNRLRREVIPYLEQLNPNLREVLINNAHSLADDYAYLNAEMERCFDWVTRCTDGAVTFDTGKWRSLPDSLQRATLRQAIRRLRGSLRDIGWKHIEEARQTALEKGTGAEASLPFGLALIVGYGEFTVGEAVPLPNMPLIHSSPIKLMPGMAVRLPGSEWQVKLTGEIARAQIPTVLAAKWTAHLDADKIVGELMLRGRQPGDRFQPSGLGGRRKSLHEFMIDEKIPRHVRDLLPLLVDGEKILWVCGWRVDERATVEPKTERVLRVEFLREEQELEF